MIITDHAARRYIRRLAPGLSLTQARDLLARVSRSAVRLPERTDTGQQMWRTTGARGAVLVVKHDPTAGLVVVTVLAAGQTGEVDEGQVAEVRAERAKEAQRLIDEAERGHVPKPRAHTDRMAREQRQAAARKAEKARIHAERTEREQSAAGLRRAAENRQNRAITMARWAGLIP